MATTIRGGHLTLTVQFYEYSGGPAYDPDNLIFDIQLGGVQVVGPHTYPGAINRVAKGSFKYEWDVPGDAALGTYIARWQGEIHAAEVGGSEEIIVAPAGSVVSDITNLFLNDPSITTDDTGIAIKFGRTVDAYTLLNEKFRVLTGDAAEVISDVFHDIDITRDYESIGRILYLRYKKKLVPNSQFILNITGLKDVAGRTIPDASYNFMTGPSTVDFNVDPAPLPIDNYSMVLDPIFTPSPAVFRVTNTTPSEDEYFVDEDYMSGRITVKFSTDPASNYVNKDYFRVQKKKVQRLAARWESVDTVVTSEANRPWVHIYFPSTDEVPVYGEAGKTYFEAGYKYRIKISKDIGI